MPQCSAFSVYRKPAEPNHILSDEIKKGKLGRALLDTTISGVAFEMLKTVDMVSDTVEWASSGYCGKKQPMPVGMGGPALRCKVMIGGR